MLIIRFLHHWGGGGGVCPVRKKGAAGRWRREALFTIAGVFCACVSECFTVVLFLIKCAQIIWGENWMFLEWDGVFFSFPSTAPHPSAICGGFFVLFCFFIFGHDAATEITVALGTGCLAEVFRYRTWRPGRGREGLIFNKITIIWLHELVNVIH